MATFVKRICRGCNREFDIPLVMEHYLRENHPDHPALVRLGENLYLPPDYEIHHRDEVRTNNRIENLEVLSNEEHRKLHLDLRERNHKGQFALNERQTF